MTVISLLSLKGAPGVTTLSCLLAAQNHVLQVEEGQKRYVQAVTDLHQVEVVRAVRGLTGAFRSDRMRGSVKNETPIGRRDFMNQAPKLETIIPIIPAGADLNAAIAFYEQLGFTRTWQEGNMARVSRDAIHILLCHNEDRHLAEWTSCRVQVTNIAALYAEFLEQGGQMIHPNGRLETKPWGMTEFAILDPAGVCLTFFER